MVLSVGFFGLISVVLPGVGMMGLAFLVLFVFFWVQYLVWGRWLYGYAVRKESESEHRREAESDASSGIQ